MKLKVELGKKSYEIIIGSSLLQDAASFINPIMNSKRVHIVTDRNVVKAGHFEKLKSALNKTNIKVTESILPAGERTKSFSHLEKLCEEILSKNIDRKTTLIALGGGVVGDITGFAASILLRSIDFIQIPTTLLAMVDSSVGGKTGINTRQGKNLAGSFHQPRLVLVDTDFISTLPEREFLAGYAEVIKYGLINNLKLFNWLEANITKIKKRDGDALTKIIYESCKAKAEIVRRDEKESGERALLNLGHTFAHAIEIEGNYKKSLHGEAVAIGMKLAFDFSAHLGLCKKQEAEKIKNHLIKSGLPTAMKQLKIPSTPARMLAHMKKDKKASGGKLTFILARGIGKSFIAKDVPEKDVLKFLNGEING